MPKGVYKIEDEVFHFPKFGDNGLSDFRKEHVVVEHPSGGPSLTRQDAKDECDINILMERYQDTGVLPNVNDVQPVYYDFTSLPESMIDAMNVMNEARDAFMSLPAQTRRHFDNDPAEFVDFASDPDNLDQMRAWGLAPPKPAPATPEASAGASSPPPPAPQASAAPATPATPAAATQ